MKEGPMNEVSRFISAKPLRQPDVFERTTFVAHEIDELSRNIVDHVNKLNEARALRDQSTMRQMSEHLTKLFDQGSLLAMVVARVTGGP